MARAVAAAISRAGNPGRAGHALAVRSARDLFEAREKLARLFGGRDSARFVFTENATGALNRAIKGLLRPGDHVVTTGIEHNSVTRPLRRMEEAGVRVTAVPADRTGTVNARDVCDAIRKETRLVAVIHASNVTGAIQPVARIFREARRRGAFTLLDAAQTAGALPFTLADTPADLVAAPGHKALLGPQGTGFLYVREGVPLVPLVEGGTGSRSDSELQPETFPECFESGTQNSVGIAGLSVALSYLLRRGVEAVRRREAALLARLFEGMREIRGVVVYGPGDPSRCVSVVSFNVAGTDPADVALRLERDFGILTRAGLHCSPGAHRAIGTFPAGTVRASLGPFTTGGQVRLFLGALEAIARGRRGQGSKKL